MCEKKRKIFVLSGPSGSGKNTVFDGLMKLNSSIAHTVSVTTRQPRTNEIDGIDYYFVSKEEFIDKINNDEFIEYVNYGDNYYGTLKSEVTRLTDAGKIVILVIEVRGAASIKNVFSDAKSIFIYPPSLDELANRLKSRGQNTEEEIQTRLSIAEAEMKLKDSYDFAVVNDDINICIENINIILNKE